MRAVLSLLCVLMAMPAAAQAPDPVAPATKPADDGPSGRGIGPVRRDAPPAGRQIIAPRDSGTAQAPRIIPPARETAPAR